MPAKYITLNAKDGSGSYTGYLALPDSGTGPGVVVIQEIFGINTPMREICDQLANQAIWPCARISSGDKSRVFN